MGPSGSVLLCWKEFRHMLAVQVAFLACFGLAVGCTAGACTVLALHKFTHTLKFCMH